MGFPYKVPFEALKDSHEGRVVAARVILDPESMSLAAIVYSYLSRKLSVVVGVVVITGASFTFVTAKLKVSYADALDPSVAVTLTAIVPTSAFVGVPEKVRFEALKESQEGRDDPFERVAV